MAKKKKRSVVSKNKDRVYTKSGRDLGPIDESTGKPYLANHTEVEVTHGNEGRQLRNISSIPLDYYLKKYERGQGGINHRQHEAGVRWYEDYVKAGLLGLKAQALDVERVDGSRSNDVPEWRYSAHERFRRGWDAVTGIGQDLCYKVCLLGFYLKDVLPEHTSHYTTTNQLMCRFREALDELADFYKLPPERDYYGLQDT